MKSAIGNEAISFTEAERYLPGIAVTLPFEPKMAAKEELELRLQRVLSCVEQELEPEYPGKVVNQILAQLKAVFAYLDFYTYKQSLAIYLSPLFRRVYYLDFPVEEQVVIDEPFEIRDLIDSKKDLRKYLVLVVQEEQYCLYLHSDAQTIRIVSGTPIHVENGLDFILRAYNLPLFVSGSDHMLSFFKETTEYADSVIDYVCLENKQATDDEVRLAITPQITDWKRVKQARLMRQVQVAMHDQKLVTGISNVCREAAHKKGRLLLVERNYTCTVCHDATDLAPAYITDMVDDAIELVLQNGGEVELVDEGVLEAQERVALVLNYQPHAIY